MPDSAKTFPPHGQYACAVDGRILRIALSGSMNAEGVQAYLRASTPLIASLAGAPWGVLAVFSEGGFLLDGMREKMIAAIRAQQQSGRCATAAVYLETVSGRGVFEWRLRSMCAEAGQSLAIFDDEASARAWLEERIGAAEGKFSGA